MRNDHLPHYGDSEEFFQTGKRYVFRKKENAKEPPITARALREFDSLGEALEWAKNNLGPDLFLIVSV
jgi:hypothetical protein